MKKLPDLRLSTFHPLCLMMLVSAVPAALASKGHRFTYTGTGTGMLDKIEVAVTFDADTITGIEVVSCNDNPASATRLSKDPRGNREVSVPGRDVATSGRPSPLTASLKPWPTL